MPSSRASMRRANCSVMSPFDDRRGADLTALYQDLILDHYRRPRNRGSLEHADATVTKKNPLCGDVITLQLELDGDIVRDAKFAGEGCAISQASASMMTQMLKGRSAQDLGRVAATFTRMIEGDSTAAADASLGELRALSGVARLPQRQQCALLAWSALTQALGSHG